MAPLDRTPARGRAKDITVRVRRLDGHNQGKLRLSPVDAPWFAVVAGTPHELARAQLACFGAVEEAAYARLKRETPDGYRFGPIDTDPFTPVPTVSEQVPAKGWRQQPWRSGGTEREVHPSLWQPNADGSFTNEVTGRTFRDPKKVAQIVRRRVAAGLPIVPVDGVFDLSTVAEAVGKAAADAGRTPHEWLAAVVAQALEVEQVAAS